MSAHTWFVKVTIAKETEKTVGKLPDFLGHRDLYKAYPNARDAQVMTEVRPQGAFSGHWDDRSPGGGALLSIGPRDNPDVARSIALHEAQHGVQHNEGFATGASPHLFAKEKRDATDQIEAIRQNIHFFRRKMDEADRSGDATMFNYFKQHLEEMKRHREELRPQADINPFDLYRNTAGEVEARNVQKRMNMTPEERRATPPWETQDVPDVHQILRQYSEGPQMSTEDILKLYRGESAHNKKGGPYYTPDREWARQFTQSGQDHEIKQASVKSADVYDPPKGVYAGDPDAIAKVVAEARSKGFKAVRLDEGAGQPASVYVFNKSGFTR